VKQHKSRYPQYAVTSQTKLFGFEDGVIQLAPREGEALLHTADILEALETHGSQIALVLMSGGL
jgi:kynureninase